MTLNSYTYDGKTRESPDYDGNRAIACVQLGTYGHWGEWHSYLVSKQPKAESLDRIMTMALNSFKKTQVMVRIAEKRSENRGIGFFHDMIGNEDHDATMDRAMTQYNCWNRMKEYMFGGEEEPASQLNHFKSDESVQILYDDIKKYNVSWMMNANQFSSTNEQLDQFKGFKDRRNKAVQMMGYDYFIESATIKRNDKSIDISITIGNDGVAPFYYPWNISFGILKCNTTNCDILVEKESSLTIDFIHPKQKKEMKYQFTDLTTDQMKTENVIGLRVHSGVGSFVLFSNKNQRENDGWFILQNK